MNDCSVLSGIVTIRLPGPEEFNPFREAAGKIARTSTTVNGRLMGTKSPYFRGFGEPNICPSAILHTFDESYFKRMSFLIAT
jgi:hypothetical protein